MGRGTSTMGGYIYYGEGYIYYGGGGTSTMGVGLLHDTGKVIFKKEDRRANEHTFEYYKSNKTCKHPSVHSYIHIHTYSV